MAELILPGAGFRTTLGLHAAPESRSLSQAHINDEKKKAERKAARAAAKTAAQPARTAAQPSDPQAPVEEPRSDPAPVHVAAGTTASAEPAARRPAAAVGERKNYTPDELKPLIPGGGELPGVYLKRLPTKKAYQGNYPAVRFSVAKVLQ